MIIEYIDLGYSV